MKLHEFQAKAILASSGIPTPKGDVATTLEEALRHFDRLGFSRCVVKAQLHAGGRGKAGGVKLVKSREESQSATKELLGKRLVTAQTGPKGTVVRRILIEETVEISKEFYLGLVIDRSLSLPVILASPAGGMEIEEIAKRNPSQLLKESFDPSAPLHLSQSSKVAQHLGLASSLYDAFHTVLSTFCRIFLEKDLSLLEINPFVLTQKGTFVVLDCKMSVDDNALYRQVDLARLRDREEENPKELLAQEVGISYIPLEGNIGCLVNGAGLAMATMDVIKLYGGEPANFLDVGGGADVNQVREAFKILLSDEKIKAVLVNIFGGIMKCDVIAQGILSALKEIPLRVPLVVRLEGTNVELGKKIIAESGLKIIAADTMDDAAQKVIAAAKTHERQYEHSG